MNDLAELALDGARTAVRHVRRHALPYLGGAGFVVSAVVVAAGARAGTAATARGLSSWLGLADVQGSAPGDAWPGALQLAGIVALLALWGAVLAVVARRQAGVRDVWRLAAAWAAPFALGPPLMDTGVYRSVAFGLVLRGGHDPYTRTPASLGDDPVVAAITSSGRTVPSAVGPLGSLLQHLAVSTSASSAVGAVVALRVLGVLAYVVIGRCAVLLAATRAGAATEGTTGEGTGGEGTAGGTRGGAALTLCVLNPLVLLFVVSAAHLDGVLVALVLGALVLAARGHWTRAVALSCLAGGVLAPGFVVTLVLVVAHAVDRRGGPVRTRLARDIGTAAVLVAAVGFVQPHGFGWASAATEQIKMHTPFAIASVVGQVLAPIVRDASYDDLAASGWITAAVAAVCTVVYLVGTARLRPVERTAGYALLAVALLAPVLHAWFLLWGCLCLAPTARGHRRVAVVALSAGACLLDPPGFAPRTANLLTGIGLAVVALLASAASYRLDRRATDVDRAVVDTSAAAGDLPHGGAHVGQVDERDDH